MACIIHTSALFSQKNTIVLRVTDFDTGEHIKDLALTINASTYRTDSIGKISLSVLQLKNYPLVIENELYETYNIKLNVKHFEDGNLDVKLKRLFSIFEVEVKADRPISTASSQKLNQIDFQNRPKNSAQDLLKLVPGLFIAQHAGGGKAEQIFIRGFDCDHGTDVASYVDGVPVNLSSHGHGQGYMDLHFLIPETVNKIAITKGPYQAAFGNFSTAATVQFNTYDSLKHNSIIVETNLVPTRNKVSGNHIVALFNLPKFSKKISSYIAADYMLNQGFFELPQKFSRLNIFSKTVFNINPKSRLSLSLSGFNSSWNASGQIPERAVKLGTISRFGSLDPSEGGITSRYSTNLSYRYTSKNGVFSAQAYHTKYKFQLFSNFTLFLNDSINGDEIEQGDERNIYGVNSNYIVSHKLWNLNNKFTIGTTIRYDAINNQLWNTADRVRRNAVALGVINELSSAIYINEVVQFSKRIRLELGARYDYFTFDVVDLLPSDSLRTNYSGNNYQTLFSPKVNLIYTLSEKLSLFLNSGIGYHSNDARATVQDKNNHTLPKAIGNEIGTLFNLSKHSVISVAFWNLELENELAYVGDDGTTENKGSSRRTGIDFSIRTQLNRSFFADIDFNISKNRLTTTVFGNQLASDYLIPLAPTLTSAGGLNYSHKNIVAAIRYRHISNRSANESNTVIAKGYTLLDASFNYQVSRLKFSINIENILNIEWNEAQFDTTSKLKNETNEVGEIHYTPGTPFALKLGINYSF